MFKIYVLRNGKASEYNGGHTAETNYGANLRPARREVQGRNKFDKRDSRLYFKGTVDCILKEL